MKALKFLIFCVLGFSACLAVFAVFAQPSAAQAPAKTPAVSQPGAGASPQEMEYPLAPASVYTDVYEPNDTLSTASLIGTMGIVPCPYQNSIVNGASFYRYDRALQDVDNYSIQLTAPAYYTFTVRQAITTSAVNVRLFLYDNNGNLLQSQFAANPVIGNYYVPQAATVKLNMAAMNYSQISDLENYPYSISICSSLLTTPTPTPTNTPTPSPLPTFTPTPPFITPDIYEPNDTIDEALGPSSYGRSTISYISNGQTIPSLNFYNRTVAITDSADWFQFYGHAGSYYEITTLDVKPGIDTVLRLYQGDGQTLLGINDRYIPGKLGSQIIFRAPYTGLYWAKINNTDPSPRQTGQTYSLNLLEIIPPVYPAKVFLPVFGR